MKGITKARPIIEAYLRDHPKTENREIAAAAGCSEDFVRHIRSKMKIPSPQKKMARGIVCPECEAFTTTVRDSRPATFLGADAIRRRRQCDQCQFRWTTYEVSPDEVHSPLEARSVLAENLKNMIDAVMLPDCETNG
jgi:C4-type Zn-finger protein